jgi:hypothetical protein
MMGASRMSMIDGFSAYNQVFVLDEDRENTTFTTPWGTFIYSKIPFGLMNAGATFQRAMDIALIGEKDKFVFIYLDDIIVLSQYDKEHYDHRKRVFLKCRIFGLSLNTKKIIIFHERREIIGAHCVSRGSKD